MQNPYQPTTPPLQSSEAISTARRVLLFGEVLLDDFGHERVIGGAPFNVARHLQALGLAPLLISRIGEDAEGRALMRSLTGFAMETSGIQADSCQPTGQVHIRMMENRHTFEIPDDQAYDHIDAEAARLAAIGGEAPPLVYFGTLAQRGATSRNALQAVLQAVDAPRLVDLNLRFPWFGLPVLQATLEAADFLKLNRLELGVSAQMLQLPGRTLQEQAENLLGRFSLKKLLLTEGKGGAELFNADGSRAMVAGPPLADVVDTVGAGDAFTAVFILGLLRGWPDPLLLERADALARAVCHIQGAVPAEDGFYQDFLQEWELV